MTRTKRFARFLVVLGACLVAMPASMALGDTTTPSTGGLGFFDVSADAAGIGAAFGNPGTQPYPTAAGLVPNASAQFSGGPAGHALASMAWPGPLAGNAGTLAGLVGVPLPPEVLANGNYPVKAEAAASGGNRDEQSLGPMSSTVDETQSIARTALSDFASPSVVSAARVVTKARSYVDGATTGSVAETVLQGVEIGGLVKIDTVRTVATAVTDGAQATLDQEVTVTGVTVEGQGATIDQDGLHVGPSSNPNPADGAVKGFNDGFTSAGMQAYVTKPLENQATGGAGSISSGSVIFFWKLGDSGQQVVLTLGGASARVQATPGSDSGLGGDLTSFGSGTSSGSADLGGFSSPVDLDAQGSFTSPSGGGGGSGGSKLVPADQVLGFEPVSALSDRVPLGWMLIGLLGMLFVGMGLHGLRVNAVTGAVGGTCPLEKGAS